MWLAVVWDARNPRNVKVVAKQYGLYWEDSSNRVTDQEADAVVLTRMNRNKDLTGHIFSMCLHNVNWFMDKFIYSILFLCKEICKLLTLPAMMLAGSCAVPTSGHMYTDCTGVLYYGCCCYHTDHMRRVAVQIL